MTFKTFSKDRYSLSALFSIVIVLIALYFLRTNNVKAASIIALSFIPLAFTFSRPGRFHFNEEEIKDLDIMFKSESGCGFTKKRFKEVDGVRLGSNIYKMVNGSDYYLDQNKNIRACGPGTALIEKFTKSGKNSKSIIGDNCWK